MNNITGKPDNVNNVVTDSEKYDIKVHEDETAILGIILRDPHNQKDYASLEPEDFAPIAHQLIFRAIQGLWASAKVPDAVSVHNALGVDSETCGGLPYLQSLISFTKLLKTTAPANQYISVVKEAARKRKLVAIANDLQTRAEQTEVTADELAGMMLKQLQDAQTSDAKWEIKTLKDAFAPREPRQYAIEGTV